MSIDQWQSLLKLLHFSNRQNHKTQTEQTTEKSQNSQSATCALGGNVASTQLEYLRFSIAWTEMKILINGFGFHSRHSFVSSSTKFSAHEWVMNDFHFPLRWVQMDPICFPLLWMMNDDIDSWHFPFTWLNIKPSECTLSIIPWYLLAKNPHGTDTQNDKKISKPTLIAAAFALSLLLLPLPLPLLPALPHMRELPLLPLLSRGGGLRPRVRRLSRHLYFTSALTQNISHIPFPLWLQNKTNLSWTNEQIMDMEIMDSWFVKDGVLWTKVRSTMFHHVVQCELQKCDSIVIPARKPNREDNWCWAEWKSQKVAFQTKPWKALGRANEPLKKYWLGSKVPWSY